MRILSSDKYASWTSLYSFDTFFFYSDGENYCFCVIHKSSVGLVTWNVYSSAMVPLLDNPNSSIKLGYDWSNDMLF